jgi:hypothetical protein
MTEGDDRIMDSFNGVTLGRDIPFDRKKKSPEGLYDVPGWKREIRPLGDLTAMLDEIEKEERRNGGASSGDDSSVDVFRGRLDGEILPEGEKEREAALRRTVDFQKIEIGGLRVENNDLKRENKALKAKVKELKAVLGQRLDNTSVDDNTDNTVDNTATPDNTDNTVDNTDNTSVAVTKKKDRHAPGYWTKYGRERRAKAKAEKGETL